MLRWLRTSIAIFLGLGGWIGLLYLPADIVGLPETYPFIKRIAEMDRETLLIWFSGALVAYLIFVEMRPYARGYLENRKWVSYKEATQAVFDEFRNNDMAQGLVRDSIHIRPIENEMGAWISDGIEEGIIKIRGKVLHSTKVEAIPRQISLKWHNHNEISDGVWDSEFCAQDENGMVWIDLEVNRASLKKYFKALQADTVQFERRKALKKERSAELPSG